MCIYNRIVIYRHSIFQNTSSKISLYTKLILYFFFLFYNLLIYILIKFRFRLFLILITGIPHYRGPHVVLSPTNKAWLFIQKRRSYHRRAIILLQTKIKKYFASKRSLSFKIARAELIVKKRAKMATRIQARRRGYVLKKSVQCC